jgi:hypothetical protein
MELNLDPFLDITIKRILLALKGCGHLSVYLPKSELQFLLSELYKIKQQKK